MTVDLRLGRWQDVLDVGEHVDSIIADPPYSARTHEGYRSAKDGEEGAIARKVGSLSYAALTSDDVGEAVAAWVRLTPRWVVLFGDHQTSRLWLGALAAAGLYTFAPVPVINHSATPRFTGDGPASATEWLAIARRTGIRDGARPGFYERNRVEGATNGSLLVGHKPLALMRAIVRDYSRPGDLVVDPYCGTGTTALACRIEGRSCITSEVDQATHAIAARRLAREYTPLLFTEEPAP